MLLRYDASSDREIARLEVRLEGTNYVARYRFDPGTVNRAVAPKLTINGTWPLLVTVYDSANRRTSVRCLPGVTVTF